MATIKNVLTLEDRMTSTFQSVEKAAKHAEKTFMQISERLDELDDKSKKVSSSTGSIFKGMLGANLVSKGISMITGQLDSAIQRFDTINNYGNVMKNLGFSDAENEASIERLKDGLDGLPTTLQDGVTSVQRFAAANENLGASTEMYLALNDAILAGGAQLPAQQAALEQVTQAYSKGKFEANEWKTMLIAMPAQLKQVAEAMGYTSTAVGGDFYTALQKGKISMNEMMKTMVELDNTTGGFAEQAKNATNGIGTAFTNMKTAITKGLADLIENINNSLKNAGLPDIQTIIKNIGIGFKNLLSTIGTIIGQVISFLSPVFQFIKNNWEMIKVMLIALIGIFVLWKTATLLQAAAQWVLNSALLACPLTWIIIGVLAIIAIIFAVVNAINEATGATNEAAENTISAVGVIMGILYILAAFVFNSVILPIWNGIATLVNFLANCFKNPVASIKILFYDMCLNILNRIRGLIQGIQDLINIIPRVEVNLVGGISNIISGIENKKAAEIEASGYTEVMQKKDRWEYSDAYSQGYSKGASFGKNLKKATDTPNKVDWNNMANNINAATGTDGSGGKAIKTTTNDDLLKDEDIQLLLDVATRDYKLNYQQVTPQITLTFGDIRETADVDDILDQVADRLEEIYDSNLEVAT